MPLFVFGFDLPALRQRQPDLIRLANRRHERGANRFAFGIRGIALPLNHACEICGEKR
jgi:hypothetical protein